MRRHLPLLAATVLVLSTLTRPAGAILPPDPLSQLVPQTGMAVRATVTKATGFGPVPTTLPHPKGWVGPALDLQAQTVTIRLTEVLRWPTGSPKPRVGTLVTVTKPVRPYRLTAGEEGVLLLDTCTKPPTLLGRYGTTFYDPAELRSTLTKLPFRGCP